MRRHGRAGLLGTQASGADIIPFPKERRSFIPSDGPDQETLRDMLPELTVAETLAIGMLICGRSFAEAAESTGLSAARVQQIWTRRQRC